MKLAYLSPRCAKHFVEDRSKILRHNGSYCDKFKIVSSWCECSWDVCETVMHNYLSTFRFH